METALHWPAPPPPDPYGNSSGPNGCSVRVDSIPAPVTCSNAHAMFMSGHVTGGASHVQLAGPILYTDVAADMFGDFYLSIPVDGNVCDLLPSPQHFTFEGDGMTVSYTIGFER